MRLPNPEFLEALKTLHREKDASYRNAWKRRGEVLSILANIARKIDRLEYVLDGAPPTRDESLFDTAVDLLVYCIKYKTFLADSDASVANMLFAEGAVSAPYSEGPAGFDCLVANLQVTVLDLGSLNTTQAASQIFSRFAELEHCFQGLNSNVPFSIRLRHIEALIVATVLFLEILVRQDSKPYLAFIASHRSNKDF